MASSEFRQTLHSAVILDRMMIVFGGNSYVNKDSKNVKCHTTKLHVYDLGELLLLICMFNKVGNQVEVPYRGCQTARSVLSTIL